MNDDIDIYSELLTSFLCNEGVNSNESLLRWINSENKRIYAVLEKTSLSSDTFWFFDENLSLIRNTNNSFFTIQGIKNEHIEQPIIVQNEVGYLGIICKRINDIIHLLMQAKIEPGNVNKVQISPTIQATESNFLRKHGGREPYYLNYFQGSNYRIIYDGEEPEQCSRFYKKFNRNVIILLDENDDLPIYHGFKWMTIGQIKSLANNHDNLVNMDTRTVLSCIPYDLANPSFKTPLFNSIFGRDDSERCIDLIKNEQKNVSISQLIHLTELKDWIVNDKGIFPKKSFAFHFEFFNVCIEGREVTRWTQPLAVANGKALFALAYIIKDNTMMFLVKIRDEIGCAFGSCFGPTIQFEAPFSKKHFKNPIEMKIFEKIQSNDCLVKTTLSEEGGRFYHEENINVICMLDNNFTDAEISDSGFVLVTYKTIRRLISKTHLVNIQLRNLLALLVD